MDTFTYMNRNGSGFFSSITRGYANSKSCKFSIEIEDEIYQEDYSNLSVEESDDKVSFGQRITDPLSFKLY